MLREDVVGRAGKTGSKTSMFCHYRDDLDNFIQLGELKFYGKSPSYEKGGQAPEDVRLKLFPLLRGTS